MWCKASIVHCKHFGPERPRPLCSNLTELRLRQSICRLAAATAENQNAVNHNEPYKLVDMSPLWAVALDRVQAWIDEAE
jgi:hypothetical protein